MKRIINVFTVIFLFVLLCFSYAFADTATEITTAVSVETDNLNTARILDGNLATYSGGENVSIRIKSDTEIGGIYLRYYRKPGKGTLDGETPFAENGFLSEYIDLSMKNKTYAELFFERAEICELQVFSKGELPQDIQRWSAEDTDTDLLLLATHSDDDQLFFAGLLPYYAGSVGARVRVAYFVSHDDAPGRLHELLAGLWECGVKYYPEIGIFPDAYSESLSMAKANLERAGYSYDSVLGYQRYLLEKYRPQIVVLHDFKGEYSHGQHIINTGSFIEEFENTQEGQHKPSKVYVHLYDKNTISIDIDTPLEAFGGRSAFKVSQDAFRYHKSQHWTWFYRWIYGSAGNITSSSQIRSYNPALYGLYYTSVGADTKNDMLENITLYEDIEEAERQAELEVARKQEEERIRQEKEKAEAEKARLLEQEAAEKIKAEKDRKVKTLAIILFAAIPVALLSAFGAARIISKKYRK